MADRTSVLIAGGGVAGLEALLALHHLAGERVDVTLLTPEPDFVFRPPAVGAPFGRGHVERRPLEQVAAAVGARLVVGSLAAVDDAARTVTTATGERIGYDALLVAVGAESAAAYTSATTWTPERDPEVLGGLLRDIDEGYTASVAFVVPPAAAWPLPAYELALMTKWQADSMGQRDLEVTIYTPEDSPLAAFGDVATAAIRAELDEVGIRVVTGVTVQENDAGLFVQPEGTPVATQRVVALPIPASHPPEGIATDHHGFILCDLHGRVVEAEAVWAAGDAVSFPIKQGGLATQQADAAAEAIAALAGADVDPHPFRPVLRGVVLTGRGRQWMRHDPAEGADDYSDERRALWWPPTKVAGRYLSPFLDAEARGDAPEGVPVELDIAGSVPAAAVALGLAGERDGQR